MSSARRPKCRFSTSDKILPDASAVIYSALVLLPKSRGCFDSDIEVAATFSGGGPLLGVSAMPRLLRIEGRMQRFYARIIMRVFDCDDDLVFPSRRSQTIAG